MVLTKKEDKVIDHTDINGYMQKIIINNTDRERMKYCTLYKALNAKLRKEKGI